jgi:cytochrome c553
VKYTALKIAVLALASISVSVAAGQSESPAIRNCTWCHGGAAQGYTPAPRLAGQRARYIEQQLISFAERTRDSPFAKQYMWGATASLSPQGIHDLTIYFSQLPPRAANDGDRGLVARGEAIYQRGIPEANIAACVACHGPNAEGVGEIPRLGGLAYTYLKRRLDQWGQGYQGGIGTADAAYRKPAIAQSDRRTGLLSQFPKIAFGIHFEANNASIEIALGQ